MNSALGKAKPASRSATSRSRTCGHSPTEADLPQVRLDERVEPSTLLHLISEGRCEPRHLLLEWLVVLLGVGRADVPAWRQDVAVAADLVERG